MLLEGKTVIVTGVGAGLGRECAAAALREGANVVIAARNKEALDAAASELDPDGKRVAAKATDITDAAACSALVEVAMDRFGSVDALVQVAAFEYVFGGLRDSNLDDWRKAFETNVLGALTILRPVADAMKQSGGGSVVLIGSQATFKPSLPQAGYAASKGALLSAMYYLADELGADNIRCNMVVPSWMWGPPVQAFFEGKAKHKGITTEEALQEVVGTFPLRRMTEDGEVADVVTFFASDLAKAVTGQHLMVNAGEMMR
ncbi:MAG TPA: SDR family oxidoreductase [Acidimicrobiales bacterium]|jgi:NAD(P)-dependent dehydrogenase (short-subunit alcohol dehydrogenase family)|nr:SDR family oxidoreductase [Acidimicrobiales bacterium]